MANLSKESTLRRVQYNENPFAYGIKRRGSCYTQTALPAELIVLNAISIYNDPNQKEKWSSYSLGKRNCEHFAFHCCVEISMPSEQVLAKYDLLTNRFSIVTMTLGSLLWGWSNAITAGIALVVEIAFLTIRWIVYLCVKKNEEKLKDYLVAGCAIDTKEYVKCLIQAGIANGVSFGMSIAGGVVGTFIPLPGATVGFSILFGFISYVIARWGSGALINIFQKLIDEKMNE
ncbi:unnamed protein product [Rotaria sp. Silwood1]|nr:unnamed protein product [Rotaria sp. Silwood1]